MCAAARQSLPDAVRLRLEHIAGARLTKDGEIVLTAGNFRTQEANRRDAIDRLVRMIRQAAIERPFRVPTRPTLGSKQRRLVFVSIEAHGRFHEFRRNRGSVMMEARGGVTCVPGRRKRSPRFFR